VAVKVKDDDHDDGDDDDEEEEDEEQQLLPAARFDPLGQPTFSRTGLSRPSTPCQLDEHS
jgi:hypothetical protein